MGVKQKTKSLKSRNSDLSNTLIQLEVLNGQGKVDAQFPRFEQKIKEHGYSNGITSAPIEIFQINIGKLCNQTCAHCHVDAGPDKKEENMDKATLERCLALIKKYNIPKVDITGGAPELNPHFRWFVEACFNAGIHVMDRCNLTVIEANKKYHDLPEFFAQNKVEIISSLPYFSKKRTDSQRGDGVFEDSISALKRLNAVGYGMPDTGLIMNLVYNPSGAFLPGDQSSLEQEFKNQLRRRYQIEFNNLFAITNLPISRFLEYLLETDNYARYMTELVDAFNPNTIEGLMCRNTISVSWDGFIYDCDFNQMLDLKSNIKGNHISDFSLEEYLERKVVLNQHCYGCTAGAGSSCGGEIH